MGAEDFAEWAYNALYNDPKYSQYLDRLITPSKDAKRKAQVSSVAGAVVGHVLGVGWKTLSGAGISFKEQSPIWMMTVRDHKEPNKTKVCFYFPVSGYISEKDFRKMEIKPKKEGMISRKVVGVKFDFDCVGKQDIENDQELKNKLFQLFTTQRLCDVSDWTLTPMTAEIEKKEDGAAGKIEVGIEQLDVEGLKTLFDVSVKMAEHMKSAVKSRGEPTLKTATMTSAPLPEIKEIPGITILSENSSWSSTLGQLCDQFIQKEGQESFDKEFSPEMAIAYRKRILNVIPSLSNSLLPACTDQRQILSFVDMAKYWTRGYPVSQGPLRVSPERRISVREFVHQLTPPSMKNTPSTWPPQPSRTNDKDLVLSKEGAPDFLVQLKFLNLSYKIFEFNTGDRAKQIMKGSIDVVGQTFASSPQYAELMVKMLPGINAKQILQATGIMDESEEKILVSRRVMPRIYSNVKGPMDSKGGCALDYMMMWQKSNLLFSIYEPTVISIWDGQERMAYGKFEDTKYDAQVLIDALTTFRGNQLFEKGLAMLKYFVENRQFLLPG